MSVLQAYLQGRQARQQQNQMDRQNAMQQYMGQNAQGIFAGDNQALGGLAAFDPMMALNLKGTINADKRGAAAEGRAAEAHQLRLAEYTRGLSKEQAAEEAAQLEGAIQRGLATRSSEEWDTLMQSDPDTQQYVGQWENRMEVAKTFLPIVEQLKMQAGAEPTSAMREYDFAVSQGYQGSFDEWRLKSDLAQGGIDPRGEVNVGDVYNPGDVVSTIELIDEIYTDPSLSRITGSIQGAGGNDVNNLNVVQRLMAGDQGVSTIEKIGQVQSRGWLAARAMLKGGGPITDYESREAEKAVARMSRAKSKEDFQSALKDFRNAMTDGIKKLEAAGKLPPGIEIPNAPWTQEVAPGGNSSYADTPIVGGKVQPNEDALRLLQADPTPEMRAYFDEVFGEGASARALGQ